MSFKKVFTFNKIDNIFCIFIDPVQSVINRSVVFFPRVDEVFRPEINKFIFEKIAKIFKCSWKYLCPEIDEFSLKPASDVFEDILSLEVCFC